MKKVAFLFCISLVLMQVNCRIGGNSRIEQLWFYTHAGSADDGDNYELSNITPASFLNLQLGGTYTRDFGNFDYGQWEKKDTALILRSIKGKTYVFLIINLLNNELQLLTGQKSVMNFESQRGKFSSENENPFSLLNNHWRIPATKKESEIEIRKRLKNHFRFNELYFKWALDNGLQSIDVRSTPSLIKIYGNGFELKKFDELPEIWRSYFFDEEDCRTANGIVKTMFDNSDISWAHTDNKFKMFMSAFQQMQRLLK